jgi:N-acetylmuramoyl-L-alanine amidase CwlA
MGKVSKVLKSASKSTKTLRSATKATAGTSSNVKGVLHRTRKTAGSITKPKPTPRPKIARTIYLDKKKYPESAKHIEEAAKKGKPTTLTIDRAGAKQNRKDSLRGYPTRTGKDRDEWPPAMSKEGGKGASVKYINPSDNRGSGSIMGQGIKGLPDGAIVKIVPR